MNNTLVYITTTLIEEKKIHSLIHSIKEKKFSPSLHHQLNQSINHSFIHSTIHSFIQSFIQAFNQTIQAFKNLKNRYPLEIGQKRPKKGYPPKTPKNPI